MGLGRYGGRAAVEEAENAERYVMAHAYTDRCIHHAVSNGVRSVEHGNFLEDETAKLMVQRDAFLVPTLSAYITMWEEGLEIGMPAELHAKIKASWTSAPSRSKLLGDAG
ncbi:hypothetical protein EN829_004370 [Mesorhizobium sp. M00.F.Ca.ET.186.01.1.1]|nr:hypothetical protein EN848_30790 [bacterium M00.F.Ca.ET.205.01.1.1]TGV40527.1 hypothetical protein EN829_004370 [Mesorhizobium sp. M00.F.Ca.ET.186.01.1.1]TGZ45531.1 hypothetical protein EN805_04350 [bacterium M00.F.Ca.ET.162.01.1.1]TIW61746.1 MAG: hypothetical protein E5V48_07995 [Mesorhizobium sp.]